MPYARIFDGAWKIGNPQLRENPRSGVLERVLPSHQATIVPYVLQARLLRLEYYSKAAGHVGSKRMYESMRRHYYWPRMAVDCYGTVAACDACWKERVNLQNSAADLTLFAANEPLESVAMDLLGC